MLSSIKHVDNTTSEDITYGTAIQRFRSIFAQARKCQASDFLLVVVVVVVVAVLAFPVAHLHRRRICIL